MSGTEKPVAVQRQPTTAPHHGSVPAPHPGPSPRAAARLAGAPGPSAALTRLTELAARLLSDDEALAVQVSLLSDHQTVAAGTNLPRGAVGSTGSLTETLCAVTVDLGGPLVVPNAQDDERVSQLSPVTSGAVGSYLGVPLTGPDGTSVGALCAFSPRTRTWSAFDVALLDELAGAVVAQLEVQALSAEFSADRLRWEVAVDAAGIGSFQWELDSDALEWDDRMRSLFGHEPTDVPGGTRVSVDVAFDRIHPADRPSLDLAVAAAIESCGEFRAEYRVRWPDGQVRWLVGRGRALPGPDGTAARLLGTVHDVTEIRTAKDDAARLLETMATGFIALDADWRLTYVNAEAAQMLGTSVERLVGHNVWELFPGLEDSRFGQQYKQAAASGQPATFEDYYEHLRRWFEVRAVPADGGLTLYFLDVTGRHADQDRARTATRRLELLAEVSAELAAAGLDISGAVARLARVVVPELGDWCIVSLVEGGVLRDVGTWHPDPERLAVAETYTASRLLGRTDLGPVRQAQQTERPVVVERGLTAMVLPMLGSDVARTALRDLAPESALVVPLLAHGQLTGVLTLLRDTGRAAPTWEQTATATEIASRAALALDNARLYAEQRNLAEGLQRSLLTTPPEPEHCEIVVRYAPAAQAASVGGDWYDSWVGRDGATVLVIGDVMGHDTVAAAAMGQLRGLLRGIAWHSQAGPAGVLTGLDEAMAGLKVATTASAVVARLEATTAEREQGRRRLRWSNAGHPPPMVVGAGGGVRALATEPDLLLGIDPGTARAESEAVVEAGTTVLLYTDGLIERRGQDLDAGLQVLRHALSELAGLPLPQLCDALLARLLPDDAEDDVALVAVRLHPEVP